MVIFCIWKKLEIKRASLLVNTNPDKTTIKIDGEVKGISPIKVNELNEGDRQLIDIFSGI